MTGYYHSGGLEPDQYDRESAAVIFGSLMGGYLPDLRDPGAHWVGGTFPGRGTKVRNSRQAYKQPAPSPVSPVDVPTTKKRATGRIARCRTTSSDTSTVPIAGGLPLVVTGVVDTLTTRPTERPRTTTAGTRSYRQVGTKPTCPRCGREFRKSGVGLAWHIENYRQCAGRTA